MTNRAIAPDPGLRPLPPEPWGDQLRRARETAPIGKVTHAKAAAWIEAITMRPIDGSTIGRIEGEQGVPADPGRRATAYLLCFLYEVDPIAMGLGPDDGPGELAERRLRKQARKVARDQAAIVSRCIHGPWSDRAYGDELADPLAA